MKNTLNKKSVLMYSLFAVYAIFALGAESLEIRFPESPVVLTIILKVMAPIFLASAIVIVQEKDGDINTSKSNSYIKKSFAEFSTEIKANFDELAVSLETYSSQTSKDIDEVSDLSSRVDAIAEEVEDISSKIDALKDFIANSEDIRDVKSQLDTTIDTLENVSNQIKIAQENNQDVLKKVDYCVEEITSRIENQFSNATDDLKDYLGQEISSGLNSTKEEQKQL